jgi:hypothetical protein
MISALLLPLLYGTPASAAAAPQDDPPIQLWINERRFLPGDRAKVQVRAEYDGYLMVFHVDPEGHLRVLFPIDPNKDNFVRGGKKYEVRGRGGREAFGVDGKGRGAVYAAVSRDPFRFDGFVMGDHWDYKALAQSRLPDDPEPELNELVQRMAQSSFDYDMITYEVIERVVYASDYGRTYYDDWCSFSCGSPYFGSRYNFSIGLFFGRPYRRYYYDPYYYAYDPFYSPFFYDPYYYAPVYYPRYYPRRYYDRYYHDRYYYWDRHRSYNRPYTPYRFRGSDGFNAGYRDRRYDLRRSINTVYNPPVSRIREPAAVSPVRRAVEGPAAELPSGVAQRRTVGHEQRLQPQRIEARRARERDEPRGTTPRETRGRDRSPEARRAAPVRQAETPRHDERREPRLERRREESRQIERSPEAAPQRREEPRQVERSPGAAPQRRDDPRQVERAPAREAPAPRREVERSSPPPSQDRGGYRSEGRGSGGSRSEGRSSGGGSRPSDGGGRRRS